MSATRPPDPWQANSSTPQHEVYEPDPDDEDTGHSRSPRRRRTTGTPPDRHRLLARELPATVPRLARGEEASPSLPDALSRCYVDAGSRWG